MPSKDYRKHEVSFCADVSKWADAWFQTHPDLPFGDSDIESFATGSNKRSDLRFYQRKKGSRGKLLLMGEVKLPGTPLGRSAFDPALLQDSYNKATAENCRYFFTWNVEELAMFDRSIWDAPTMHERQVGYWKLGLKLNNPTDVTKPEVKQRLFTDFLPRVLNDVRRILSGERKGDFALAPSDFYIAVLESHLAGPMGPVRELRDYLAVKSAQDSVFDARLKQWMLALQWNFDRKDPESWQEAVDRAAHSMVYVLSNRILFYQAVRLRNYLPDLRIPKTANTAKLALQYLKGCFKKAVDMTGDYEPVFFPDEDDSEWAATTALSGTNSIEGWRKVIEAVERFQFKEIPTDVLGGVFQKLISPEERHKFGQHYTDENIVDVINAFCLRKGDDVVLDPACGSGGFLVRAYYRKAYLGYLSHHEELEQLYGADINPFPAHLATLNLAARNISNEENYPRIARKNFFLLRRDARTFCVLPGRPEMRLASVKRKRSSFPIWMRLSAILHTCDRN
jgi:N-6 DNA Methylase